MAQPTTSRENRSRSTATYSQPSVVQTYVVSLTHFVLGSDAVKSLPKRLGAMEAPARRLVPTGLFRFGLAHNSISRMSLATRSLEQWMPLSRNSTCTRGLPYTPRLV